MVLPSLEVAGPGGHWVEVSRAICAGEPSGESREMMEAYEEYYDAARGALQRRRDGARRPPRGLQGLQRPRLRARPRHRPLDRHDDDRVPEDRRRRRDRAARAAWCSRCTRTRSPTTAAPASTCRTPGSSRRDGGVPLADLPMRIFDGTEQRAVTDGPKLLGADPARRRRRRTTSATCAPRSCSRCRRTPTNGCTATSCSSRPCTSPRSSG